MLGTNHVASEDKVQFGSLDLSPQGVDRVVVVRGLVLVQTLLERVQGMNSAFKLSRRSPAFELQLPTVHH